MTQCLKYIMFKLAKATEEKNIREVQVYYDIILKTKTQQELQNTLNDLQILMKNSKIFLVEVLDKFPE